ncbi:MAG TPA: hypothetical protein VHO68_10305 [Bacteroidales bacterium]|nr:hypothetical protein [Bacteroidales bacterium]
MRKLVILLVILVSAGCREKNVTCWLTQEKALHYFNSVEELCRIDSGKLWGKNLYGPIMFVDRTSRLVFTNSPDKDGLLKGKDGVYSGFYPKEQIVSIAPVVFGGTEFALAPIPTKEDEGSMKRRAIHSLFHLFQKSEGIPPALFNQSNMEDQEARMYMKLEWKALRKAIQSEGDDRLRAIRDALVFRGTNREIYSRFANEANHFENYEGLATYTFYKLCSSSNEECRTRLLENLDRIYNMSSYSRSYGVIHGALYAALLYDAGIDFRTLRPDSTDLGKLLREHYSIDLPEICRDVAGSLAFSYDIDIIKAEEEKRIASIKESLHKQTSTFTEKAIVLFELESPSFDFEPEDIHPLDTMGILYSSMRVSDNWGKLTVDKGGCLLSNNYKYLRITARGFSAEKNHISGEGWHLILNEGWELKERNENYLVTKLIPR